MNPVYLLIGGNIGDRLYYLDVACRNIEQHSIKILRKSPIYETAAWGNTAQTAFLNQVIEVSTQKTAAELLNELCPSIAFRLWRQLECFCVPSNDPKKKISFCNT